MGSEKCEVMNKTSVIPGLFAAGRVAGAEAANHVMNWNIAKGKQQKIMANTLSNGLKRINLMRNQLSAAKEYTWDDIKKHNQEGNCWVVVRDNVYDVSEFMEDHPGGKE